MATVYLTNALPNALLIPPPGKSRKIAGMTALSAAGMLHANGFVSAVGHQSTAQVLSDKLGLPISFNRIQIAPIPGDILIVAAFIPPRRLAEGELFTEEEILKMDVRFCKILF